MSTFGSVFELLSLNGANGFTLNGEEWDDQSGRSVASAGDMNGDGFDDLIIGARWADPNGNDDSGASYVVFGAAGGFAADLDLSDLNGANGFKIVGEAAADYAGWTVASAGDVNGDGFADVIIGATGADKNGTDSGAAYVVFGQSSGFAAELNLTALNGTNGFQINGDVANDLLGFSVASAGDFNRDGFDDVIIGAPGADENGINSGAAYVVFGKASGFAAEFDLSALNGTNGFQLNGKTGDDEFGRRNTFGFSVASAADVNGDGFDDLIIGAFETDQNYYDIIASYVVFGADGGFAANLGVLNLNGVNGFQMIAERAFSQLGLPVASAGDLNGDGFGDLIIGSAKTNSDGGDYGAAYVVFGAAGNFDAALDLSTLDGIKGFQLSGDESAYSRFSVASAGDVNGDGFDDLIIGDGQADINGSISGTLQGASYLVFGAAGGIGANLNLSALDGTNGFQLNGEGANDYAGEAVASAGDVNGDGFDDLIIGAFGALGYRSGVTYIIFGKATKATTGADTMSGHDGSDTINGLGGNDVIFGVGGDDELAGDLGNDTIYGDAGNDVLDGGAGNDIMYGGAGNDVFIFDSLNDRAFDTGGLDEVRATFTVNLTSTAFAMMESAALLGTGNLNLTGGAGANALTGNAGRNVLLGAAGSDTIVGGAGNDTITGGAGRDVLTGGLNNDAFRFALIDEMTTNQATTDTILDFRRGQDKIDLSLIDASTALAGNNNFTFDGKALHGTSKEGDVYFKQFKGAGESNDYTLIYFDTDADKASEGVIKVMGLHNFTAGDFIL